jgi:hypothetical protein
VAGTLERYFFALGRAARAVKDSAKARAPAEPPPADAPPAPAPPTVELVRCPRCGGYGPAGRVCACTP